VPDELEEGSLMTTHLHIDWTRCDGHGSCVELLPNVLGIDDFGFPVPRSGERDPVIRRPDHDSAQHAVRNCPVMALRLYEPTDRR
jgi:ferredoxin